ncbi:hypothetical protein GUJ93_ZPchr0002g23485 [Zizania palustris]|uniref:Uncharacterized protein n=1 Tax=Zizania palustris TaxID=103762 RepID=A0A8J5VUJ5_ZIZPA|nr:hypothetical protein GUJ93_ZPchr0002g23485 [Zizania palustris]
MKEAVYDRLKPRVTVRLLEDEVILEPPEEEVVVFEVLFDVGLGFPTSEARVQLTYLVSRCMNMQDLAKEFISLRISPLKATWLLAFQSTQDGGALCEMSSGCLGYLLSCKFASSFDPGAGDPGS